MYKLLVYSDELYHYGVKGMRWGVRRYQNYDGTRIGTGSGSGGGGGGRGAALPAGTTNTLNPLTGQTNLNANVPNTMNAVAVSGNWFMSGNKWQFSDENGNDYKKVYRQRRKHSCSHCSKG